MLQYIHIIRKYLKFLSKISFLLLFLSIFVNELGVTGDPQTCNKSRIILTDSWGVFSDGPQDYLAESHCEWLIRAPLDLFINLNITSLDTECSYDHLYVYDGATYDSQLLAVFSGSSTPSPLTAKSGAMLILLYSDTNYMRSGFEAVYSITDCMFNCSNNGQCVEHKCSCFPGYEGEGCEIEQCPGDCGSSENRGRCAEDSQGRNFCHCQQNYTGDSCSLNSEAPNTGVWHWVHRNGRVFKPRTSHGTVYFPESDRMMVFGGNDLNEVYDDLIIYNFTDGVWFNNKEKSSILFRKNENAFRLRKPTSPARKFNEVDLEEGKISLAKNLSFSVTDNNTVSVKLKNGKSRFVHRRNTRMVQPTPPPPINHNRTPSPSPRPRFGHCVQSFQQYLVSYGGKLKDGRLTGELWVYDSLINEWKLMSNWSRSGHPSHPPPLAFCTLTAVDKWLYLFGGSLDHGIFSNAIFRLAPTKDWTWEKVRVLGGKDLDVRLVGHTTVFYSGARSLYVYGGIKINIARFSKLSNQLFAFNVDRNYWSEIHYPQGSVDGYPAPLERAFHSSLIAGNYMVVYGGYVHKHKEEELCYDNRLYLFHLGCHVWLSNELTRFNQTDLNAPNSRGVYGHGAFLRGGNTIVVVGGFRGSVTNQVSAYVLPSTLISTDDIPFDGDVACRAHETQSLCVLNLECGWCATDGVCYDRSKSSSCITNLQTSSCPGLCSTLSTCQSCLIHSRDGECGWCVKARKCLSRPSSFNKIICGSSHLSQGWWGSHDQLLTSLDECISKDIPAGLVFMQYKEPTNYSQPDNVRIITDINRDLRSPVDSRDPLDPQSSFMSKYRLKGFLHPFQMEYFSFNKLYNYMEPLRLILKGYNLNATLFLSSDDSESNLQKVAYVIDGRIPSSEATRIDGDPLMSNFNRHLFQLDISPAHLTLNSTFNLSLIWRFGSQDPSSLTVQNLEPFGLGENCAKYSNCLACMSDYMCGWYNPHSACIPRNYTGHYAMLIGGQQLIWDSALCDQCEDFITCEDCLRFSHCEWVVEKAHCTRRGRYGSAVRERAECPIPCHLRNSCRSCLGDPGLCAWCETSKECFLFSVYTSYFQYGACRVWKDEDHLNTSRIEASAKLFKSIVDFDDVNGSPSNVAKEDGMCVICEVNSDCESCLAQIECGWCHSEYDPKRGLCTRGSFDKPYRGDCAVLMERTLSRRNAFVPAPSLSNRTKVNWAYASCPDVDECQLFLHDCHPNASCVNTDGGYSCVCPRGFTGNGKISCERTCYEDCVHGKCSGGPDFKCECNLGWTGPDCSVNCGCNNHSTCKKVGECNHCQGETTGKFCELCKSGSYGNATTVGCTKCSCNGHWDEARGRCDRVTGECFCVHNTFGRNCDMCRKGFYGDPRNSGHCYRECTSRGLVVNATRGHFGSKNVHEPGMEACLWIISAHSSLTPPRSVLKGSHIIQVLIEKNEIDCGLGALFVYEGIPSFISMKPSADQQNLIGVFCKGHASFPLAVEARSGIMTVFYEKISSDQEFLASYEALTCPRNPGKNRHCFFDKPVCKDGWKDVDCSLPVCPNKCSEGKGRGRCDVTYGRCLCHPNYVGEDCSIRRQNHMVILEELFNPLKISASFSHLHKVLPRFGHTLIVDHQGSLWVFGGYSLSRGPLNDIQRFDTRNKTWSQITVNVHPGVHPPPQRYFHAASYVDSYNEMYVYGGKNKTHFLADFWKFSILSESWTLLSVRENLPPLAGHTLTYKGESNAYSLVLIGGISSDQGFLEEVWEYDVLRYRWQRLVTRGARPIGIYGHSTVYHESTHSFYIYGGYVYGSEGISLNNHLYALDYLKKKWSVLPPDGKINHNPASRPAPRAFHAAVSTEQYLVLISGLIMDRLSSNQDLLVYSYKCNMWIPLNNHFITVAGHDLATPLLGVSAAMFESSIYVVGGISGRAHGSVIKITIPQDLCTLNANKTQCRDRIGCANCVIYDERGTNTSFCYSNVQPEPSTCLRPHGKLTSVKGIQCDSIIFEDRECYQYKTCSQCLASWPSYPDAKQLCQWCFGCRKGKCIPQTSSCADDSACSGYEEYVMYSSKYTTDIDLCPEYLCPTSSCERCHEFSHCAWSNGYLNNNEYKHTKHLSRTPPQDSWKCVNMSMENNVEGWSSSKVCPKPCHIHRTCDTCLKVPQCMWSTTHRKCISSLIVFLDCLGGTCGRLIEDTKQCPPTCNIFSQCNHCLSQAHCGWCSVSTEVGGLGICTEGLMEAPLYGRCRDLDYSVITLNATLRTIFKFDLERFSKESEKQEMISWHFEKCPPEDECLNQHHTCNSRKEVCENRFDGYVCRCAPGYQMNDDNFCAPVCDQGCLFGKCVDPNKCICDFGYVGYNCSVKCQCNGHSNCPGPDRLTECFECHNNTIGAQCQQCKPNFVGNPLKNEKCKSCLEYCYGHTSICVSQTRMDMLNNTQSDISIIKKIDLISEEEPMTDAVCLQCEHMTTGSRCDSCVLGYFRGTTDRTAPCRACQCNGHGSICNADFGTYCDCKNNTETPCEERMRGIHSKEEAKDCSKEQCSKCKEPFLGKPTDGHQCYRQMSLEKEFCLDPITQDECYSIPSALPKGKAIFFAIRPKFNNVDIRLFVDIAKGGVDVHITTFMEGFTVTVNNSNWEHKVQIDRAYPITKQDYYADLQKHRTRLFSPRYDLIGASAYLSKLGVQRLLTNHNSSFNRFLSSQYYKYTVPAKGLHTYFKMSNPNHFLVVKNLTDRLIVTLPKQRHNLTEAKFYIVILGVGLGDTSDSYGSIFFRQDQPRIDLFVFFSVFFSCFFLFLALCVVVWKVKQGIDHRRARQRHVVEMLHMAKRPFSSTTLVLDLPEFELGCEAAVRSPVRRKRACLRKDRICDRFEVSPVALEPTEDGVAAVATVVLQMPGIDDRNAEFDTLIDSPPQRLALGSVLCLVSRVYPSTSRAFQLRRRTSHL